MRIDLTCEPFKLLQLLIMRIELHFVICFQTVLQLLNVKRETSIALFSVVIKDPSYVLLVSSIFAFLGGESPLLLGA